MDFENTGSSRSASPAATSRWTRVLLVIYLVVLNWILVFKLGTRFSYSGTRSVNFIPFSRLLVLNGRPDAGELILNVLVFVPLGIYAGILFPKWGFGKKLFFFFLVSLGVECLQFFLAVGASDITDILTNTSGGVTGLLVYKGLEKTFRNREAALRFINGMAAVGTVAIIVFLVLLKMNLLPIRYQ
ncbi:MAG TPA: VanZ family protein [Chitinophagaceae bacterium]|nr:VanZ family protein [Chitinophagaceae bacterium]